MSIAEVVITNSENDLGKKGVSYKTSSPRLRHDLAATSSCLANATAAECPHRDLAATLPPPRRGLTTVSLRLRRHIVFAAKELRSTLRSVNLPSSPRHHLLCSPNALDRRASHHHRRGTRLHHRAFPPLSTPATIVILTGAQAVAMEERTSSCRGYQVGEGRFLSLFMPKERKPHKSFA
ncbi:hypothetical protein LR48_Vigan10g126400 [Vigna angularis]|uniref:Uncharacterized protein n=1 Tax=Phaseolus angularis TaxID=3914 RepID=A0A0L9VKC6_PHAAN|nr:hypothetical protein LR48_Vigan10g126400 [Vigna angularis]